MHGKHSITHWSSTQSTVALSSAEAELNALLKAVSGSLGIKNMMSHAGVDMIVEVFTDSSAARGIVHRTGCGKAIHLEARQLWIQEAVESKDVKVSQVSRVHNPSDALTHHWSGTDGYRHLSSLGLTWK